MRVVQANIGSVAYGRLDRWLQAQPFATRAAAVAAANGQAALEGWALTVLARIRLGLRQAAAAEQYARRALKLHRSTGYRIGEARALVVLGDAAEPHDSHHHWRVWLDLLTAIGMASKAGQIRARLAGARFAGE